MTMTVPVLTDTEKLKVLEQILMDLQQTEACYPDGDIADAIVEKYREQTGDERFAQ